MSEYDTSVPDSPFYKPLNLIKSVHHAHFRANKRTHLKIYIGGPLMPAAQWGGILYDCNNPWDCELG